METRNPINFSTHNLQDSAPTYTFASFNQRAAAWMIDVVVFLLPTVLIFLALGGGEIFEPIDRPIYQQRAVSSAQEFSIYSNTYLLNLGLQALYQAICLRLWGKTIGCFVMRIRVMQLHQPSAHLSILSGIWRAFACVLSTVPVAMGYLWTLWDERKQTWHDKLSGAIVIRD
jgi:uncharacterized RDD family membrane protein YckC